MYLKGALICLLALSVGIDAGKKKLLKKLAKELGYKLEDAIKSNLKDDVAINNGAIKKLVDNNDMWFEAIRNSPFSASGAWTTLTYESQRGGSYNLIDLSTGIFTAPVSGVFEFQFQGMDPPGDGIYGMMRLVWEYGDTLTYSSIAADEVTYDSIFGTAIINLSAGDQVWVETWNSLHSGSNSPGIHFTGKMLSSGPWLK